jgi:hypothetical protein
LSGALKTGVFNTGAVSMLNGNYYLLNDFNSTGAVVAYPIAAQSINAAAAKKTFKLDVEFDLRMEFVTSPTIRYGTSGYQLCDSKLIFPFYVYWLVNTSKNATVLVGGELMRFSNPTGDGFGALAKHKASHIINAASLSANNLDSGIIQMYMITGFKVASSADSTFTAAMFNKYLVEPRLSALATYQ